MAIRVEQITKILSFKCYKEAGKIAQRRNLTLEFGVYI